MEIDGHIQKFDWAILDNKLAFVSGYDGILDKVYFYFIDDDFKKQARKVYGQAILPCLLKNIPSAI